MATAILDEYLGAALQSPPEGRVSNDVELEIMRYLESEFEDSGIDRCADIFALGYVNSLFALELVTFVERRFDITIGTDDLDLDNFRSVEAMARLVGTIRAAAGR
ncbi:acyl carrier protein [Actinophytocola xinjiangensis]|uniref:acyl carrier protein n=1 Tax=Actinophytocola xinjiangensis TaxID=485602 RepID=UPI000A935A15|nr:acyl carrier protein [Actinophytocola xinjiangensis]